jgi:hypothetical protein
LYLLNNSGKHFGRPADFNRGLNSRSGKDGTANLFDCSLARVKNFFDLGDWHVRGAGVCDLRFYRSADEGARWHQRRLGIVNRYTKSKIDNTFVINGSLPAPVIETTRPLYGFQTYGTYLYTELCRRKITICKRYFLSKATKMTRLCRVSRGTNIVVT